MALISSEIGYFLASSYLLEIKNYKTTLRDTNLKIILLFCYFQVTNWKLKNKELQFESLTRSQKLKRFTSIFLVSLSIYQIEVEKEKVILRVNNSMLKNI